jgi:transposase
MPRRTAVPIALTEAEREELERNVRRRKGASALAQRSRMVLLAADGLNNRTIAAHAGVSAATAGLWRKRFAERRLAGLRDAPRGGRPRRIDDGVVKTVIQATLGSAPEGAAHWSTRLMARKLGMSQSAISRIWRASGLSPHRTGAHRRAGDGRVSRSHAAAAPSTNVRDREDGADS